MNGFFVVKKNGRYYRGKGDFVNEKIDAYAFMFKYLADRLALRIGGTVEQV